MSVAKTLRDKVSAIESELNEVFSEREDAIHGSLVALLSAKHVLMLGPPGTGKSLLARQICSSIVGANFFQILLNKFSGQEDVFGPISAAELKKDRFVRKTTGYLPWAHIAILDEIFKANSAILNSLLSIVNEGLFPQDGEMIRVPLMTLFGASNEVPEADDGLEAFDDRLHIRFIVERITDREAMKKMLQTASNHTMQNTILLEELEEARRLVTEVTIPEGVMGVFLDLWALLVGKEHPITDRVFKQSLDIMRAEAWLNGRTEINEDDFEVLRHVFWKDEKRRGEVHLEILNATNPEKHKITDIFNEIQRMVADAFDTSKKGDATASGVEILTKIKKKRMEVDKIIKKMESLNKDTKEARRMMSKITSDLARVAQQLVGFEIDVEHLK